MSIVPSANASNTINTNASLPFQKMQLFVKRVTQGQRLVVVAAIVGTVFGAVFPSHILGGHLFHFCDDFRNGNRKHFDRLIFDQKEPIFFTTNFTPATFTITVLSNRQ